VTPNLISTLLKFQSLNYPFSHTALCFSPITHRRNAMLSTDRALGAIGEEFYLFHYLDNTGMYTHTFILTYFYIYKVITHTHTHAHIYIHIYRYICILFITYIHTHIYIYIYIYTPLYIYMYIQSLHFNH